MSSSFEVVTDITRIAQLNKELGRRLSKTFKVQRERIVAHPAGRSEKSVFFQATRGTNVRAWSPFKRPGKLINFLLAGDPTASTPLHIDVQLNFPAGKYNRRMAGAFLTDEKGVVLVAHRGTLTKEHARLPKARVLNEFGAQRVEAEDQGKTSELILISALNDPRLSDRLWSFAAEARRVAAQVAAEETHEDSDGEPTERARGKPLGRKDPVLKLRDYFAEYAGHGTRKGHSGGKRTVEHGDIVKALEARLRENGRSQKAQAIDLAIVAAVVDLYEVKTSARTTDVYTGVGQLFVHGECIRELLKLPVRRHLVLPEPPRPSHGKHISKKGGIKIVTYKKAGAGYKFSGLF
jgi:hypothetical protein